MRYLPELERDADVLTVRGYSPSLRPYEIRVPIGWYALLCRSKYLRPTFVQRIRVKKYDPDFK